jgi:hypothetical protein
MRVADDRRSPTADQIDVSIAIDVEDERPLGPIPEYRLASNGAVSADRTIDAANQDTLSPLTRGH